MKIAGIYSIEHTPSGRSYVGSAQDIIFRWRKHKEALKRGNHHSKYLQRVWDKYSEEEFVFSVLYTCAVEDLYFYEQLCLDGLSPVFNSSEYAKGPVGCGQKLPKEWVDKVAVAVRKRYEEGFTVTHPPRSSEYRALVSKAVKARYKNPGYKDKIITAIKLSMTPEECMARAERAKKLWATPEYRKKAIAVRKGNAYSAGYKCTPEQILNRKRAARISNMKRNYGDVWELEYIKRYPEFKGDIHA